MNDEIAIKVDHVSKTFKLPHEKTTSIKSAAINFYKRKKSYEAQEVLKDVSFEIKKGEFFGIVGRNGSGKSTLLKMLAGIYMPNKGTVSVKGKLTPFIELGVGFNPELTGRENVFLNGALLGFNRKEMEAMYDDIVEFAEIEKFMDQKLKNYSSGMQVRLAFSIAIRAESDVLLIDEVLAVGDTAFQRKCFEHFVKLKKEKRTVVLVTHDMGAVERFCDRAMVIDKSEFKGIFTPRDAGVFYEKINQRPDEKVILETETTPEKTDKNRWGSGEVQIKDLSIIHNHMRLKRNIRIPQGDDLQVSIKLVQKDLIQKDVVVGLAIFDQFGVNLSGPNSIGEKFNGTDEILFSVKNLAFNPGEYYVTAIVFDQDVLNEYDHIERAISFDVTADSHQLHGKINLYGKWAIGEKK